MITQALQILKLNRRVRSQHEDAWCFNKILQETLPCFQLQEGIVDINILANAWASDPILTVTPLKGDKVSMLTHTYPYKPLRKIEVAICNHQADSPLYVWPNVWSSDLQV